MRFALNDEQAALRDAVRELLERECPPAVVRAGWPGAAEDAERPRRVWAKLAEMGVLGAAVPEDRGGLGLGACDVVPLLEQAGRVALPLPLVESAFVAAPLLAAAGDPGERLARVLDGELLVAASLDGSGLVPFAGVADLLLLGAGGCETAGEDEADDAAAGSEARGAREAVVDDAAAGGEARGALRLLDASVSTPVESIDGARRLGRVAPADLLAGEPLAVDREQVAAAWRRGVLGSAAQLIGLSRTLLALSTDYVKERRQFGVPVGSFQAVKHHLADALLALEFAAPPVLRAAWSLDAGAASAARDVALAKALASDAAERVAATALQVHGAIAYTTEYDLQLFAKRVWASARTWGDAESQRARVGAALGLSTITATGGNR